MGTTLDLIAPEHGSRSTLHASFPGMMRGEFLKIARLCALMLAILAAGCLAGFLLGTGQPDAKTDLQHTPLHFLYYAVESNMVIFRIFSGIFLLVLASFIIGREYQYGTIRILLARGAGRVRLLLAKLAVLAVIALVLLVLFTLLIALLTGIWMLLLVGNLNALPSTTPAFWSNIGIDMLSVLINMGATILLAAAMNALGRSLTFGLSASLIWFPLDNVGTLIMNTLTRITHNELWHTVTTYLLGPLLNRLPTILLPIEARSGFESFGSGPLSAVSSQHALWVIGAYSLVFFVLAIIPTWKRDVKE